MTEITAVRAHHSHPPTSGATRITITPDSNEEAFFGSDGLTFGDLVDAVNPLNHIPIVSDLMGGDGAEKPSVASKLLGGALLGGPIGFVASLVNVIFEQATGHGVAGAVVAALSGETPEGTQYAAADSATPDETPIELAQATQVPLPHAPAPEAKLTLASADTSRAEAAIQSVGADRYAEIARRAKLGSLPDTSGSRDDARDDAILSLFGASQPAATAAYRNAQLLPYLKDANNSQLL